MIELAEMEKAARELESCICYLKQEGRLKPGAVVVLGCSTSEIIGGVIGHDSAPEMGKVIAETMLAVCAREQLCSVFQCCEHLNRTLIMEQSLLDRLGLVQVNAVPYPKAGGSVGAAAYRLMKEPAAAMSIQADAAIDVGDTLVGMHLRPVAVPLRMNGTDGRPVRVGQAHVVIAYSRFPYIGGSRAKYTLDEE